MLLSLRVTPMGILIMKLWIYLLFVIFTFFVILPPANARILKEIK